MVFSQTYKLHFNWVLSAFLAFCMQFFFFAKRAQKALLRQMCVYVWLPVLLSCTCFDDAKEEACCMKKNLFLSTYFIKGSFAYSLFGGNFIIWVWLVLHFHRLVISVSYGPSDYKVKRFCTKYFSAFFHLFNILFFKKAFRILLQSKPSCFSQSDLRKHAMLLPQHHHFLFFSKKIVSEMQFLFHLFQMTCQKCF